MKKINFEVIKQLEEYSLFLKNTDFYYSRLAETGESVPEDIVIKRKKARAFIKSKDYDARPIQQTI